MKAGRYDWTTLAGWSGVVGALGWIIGDILMVGRVADPDDFPMLFAAYGDQIDVRMAQWMVGVPRNELIGGALIAVFTMPLYLLGCWHLWQGLASSGQRLAWVAIVLIAVGYATSPLPHATFYFIGAAYQTILTSDAAAHAPLLALAAEFKRVLTLTYVPSVASSALGLIAFSWVVASGRSAYPRWFALTSSPLLAVLTIVVPEAIGGVVGTALAGAGFNTLWLLIYMQSLFLLRRRAIGGTVYRPQVAS
jgi:hypothetical protein